MNPKDSNAALKYYSELGGIKAKKLRNINDYREEIKIAVGARDVQLLHTDVEAYNDFHSILVDVLLAESANNQLNDFYNKVQYHPAIILMLATANLLNTKELRRRCKCITVPDKSKQLVQDLFDWLLTNDKQVQPDDVPDWAKPLAYGWEDLGVSEDDLLGFIENLQKSSRVWPPLSRLPAFVASFKFADPDSKELCEIALKELRDA